MTTTIRIYPDTWAALCAEEAGKKYRPGNGTEGAMFINSWCGTCERDHGMLKGLPLEDCDDNQTCGIIADTYLYDVNDPKYPAEWQYGKDGQPRCTAYVPEGQPIPVKDEYTADLFAEVATQGETS